MSAAAELVRRTTATQGLPERVTDPATLARVAALLAGRNEGGPKAAHASVTTAPSSTEATNDAA